MYCLLAGSQGGVPLAGVVPHILYVSSPMRSAIASSAEIAYDPNEVMGDTLLPSSYFTDSGASSHH